MLFWQKTVSNIKTRLKTGKKSLNIWLFSWSLQVKHYENQLEEEYDEKKKLMSEKKELERQIQELGAMTNNRDRGGIYLLVNKISCFINLWQVLWFTETVMFMVLCWCLWKKSVMRRKFKQWWSTIPKPITTKRTITSHLRSLNTKRGPGHMMLEIQVLAWDRHEIVVELN